MRHSCEVYMKVSHYLQVDTCVRIQTPNYRIYKREQLTRYFEWYVSFYLDWSFESDTIMGTYSSVISKNIRRIICHTDRASRPRKDISASGLYISGVAGQYPENVYKAADFEHVVRRLCASHIETPGYDLSSLSKCQCSSVDVMGKHTEAACN